MDEVNVINGYSIVVNEAFGNKWVHGAWKNGRYYNTLPRKVIEEINRKYPDTSTNHVMRRGD